MTGILAIVALVLLALTRVTPPSGWRIVDGDTLERKGRRFRLQGYDAPEWDQPHGPQARRALATMLDGSWSLALTVGIDGYERRLVWMATTRGPVASRMILSGHGHAEDPLGRILQALPWIARRGLWRGGGAVHPRAWRKANPRPQRLPRRTRSSYKG